MSKILLEAKMFLLLLLASHTSICYGFHSETPGLFQGDIIPDGRTFYREWTPDDGIVVKPRLAVNRTEDRWPGANIYYFLDAVYEKWDFYQNLTAAFHETQDKTCLRFKRLISWPTTSDVNFVHIKVPGKGGGCNSYVGVTGKGKQELNLEQPGCNTKNVVIHELLHAAGLYHQHSRPDRDEYIIVFPTNIQAGDEYNFRIVDNGREHPTSFDFNSIMLYDSNTFSSNSSDMTKDTIRPKYSTTERLPDSESKPGMSAIDAAEINALYKCYPLGDGSWKFW